MKIMNSWAAAARLITRRAEHGKVSIVSCDVFDTLLIRKTSPQFVTDATCRFVADELDIPISLAKSQRNRAWAIVVSRSVSNGMDAEASVGDHFLTWMRLLVGDRMDDIELGSLATRVVEKEIEFEQECLAPNVELARALCEAKTHGVKVVAVSDMYLTSTEIATLLRYHGFGEIVDSVASSADYHLQKKTGRLFKKLADIGFYGEAGTASVLHVGDDTRADGVKALRNGIKSIVVYDRREMASRALALSSGKGATSASVSGDILRHITAENGAVGLGAAGFGPIYAGFIHGVAAKAVELKLGSVWFLAREGWLLHELYQTCTASGLAKAAPPSGYLYASRLSTMKAQLDTFGQTEMKSARDNTADHSLGSILAPLGVPADELADLLGGATLSLADQADEATITTLDAYAPFKEMVRSIGERELAGMRDYLTRTGFPQEGRVGIVDVGWGGQIQENIEKVIRKLGWKTEIFGLYLGTDHRAETRRDKGMSLTGIVSDTRRGGASGVGAFSFVQGLELATRSQHGSVKGYDANGCPVLTTDGRGRTAEEVDDPIIANIQIGIVNYATQYFRYASMAGIDAEASVDHARDVVDVLSLLPRRQDAGLVLSFNNVANLGMEDGLMLGGEASVLRPRKLVKTLRTTLWQEGTCAYALPFLGPLAMLLHRKRRRMLPEPKELSISASDELCQKAQTQSKVVSDVLALDLSSVRQTSAAEANPTAVKQGQSRLWSFGFRNTVALAAISRLHGRGTGRAKEQAGAIGRACVTFAVKHPFAELAKIGLKKLI
jgi:FMN phosphatase YigB (HAD superfamily)